MAITTKTQQCPNCEINRDPRSNDPHYCKRGFLRAGMPGLWAVAGVVLGIFGTVVGISWRPLMRLNAASWILFFGMLSLSALSIWLLSWAGHLWRFRVLLEFGLGSDGLALLPALIAGFATVALTMIFFGVLFPDAGICIGATLMFLVFAVWASGELACCNCANAKGWKYYRRSGCASCKKRKGAAPAA